MPRTKTARLAPRDTDNCRSRNRGLQRADDVVPVVARYAARVHAVGPIDIAEGIRKTVTMTAPEAAAAIHEGKITDGFTTAAYTRAWLAGLITPTPH